MANRRSTWPAGWLLDRARCSGLARRVRETGAYDGLLVPTVAMLDRSDRWNLVVFTDCLRRTIETAVGPGGSVLLLEPVSGP